MSDLYWLADEQLARLDANGLPLSFFMTAGQMSGYTGAVALLDELPKAQWMFADRGYDAD